MPLIGAQGPGSNISWRGNLDEYPDPFSFVEVTEVFPGLATTCAPVTITGINYKALVTAELQQPASAIAAGIAASIRVTPYIEETDSYGPPGDFLPGNDPNNIVLVRNKDKIELEVLTQAPGTVGAAAFNATYSVDVNIGKRGPEGWFARTRLLDDDPDPFDFTDQDNLEINTVTNSDIVTVTGIDDTIGVDINVVGTGELRINGGAWSSTGKIFDGDTLQVRNTTSNFYQTSVTTTVLLGIFTADFVITTRDADITISAVGFEFTDLINVEPNSIHESNTVTISGADDNLNGNNPLNLEFSGNGEYQIIRNGTTVVQYTDVSPSTCNNGDVIQLKQTASGNYSAQTDATLTVSNQTDTFSVTTRPRPIDTIPDAFTFTDQTNVLRNETIYSNTITLAGMTAFGDEGTASISGTSGANAEYQVTRSGTVVRSWTSGTFGVQLGDQIQLRLLSATASVGTARATFTVAGTNTFTVISGVDGSTSDTWNVTSKERDCGISSFSLPDISQSSSTLTPGDQAKVEFTVGGTFEFDCNITASTSNSNSFLKKKGTSQQGSSLSDVKVGDVIEVYMTTPYYCETRSTTVSLSAAFTTSGSSKSANWTIAPKAPPKPTLNLTADDLNPPFVFPDGGSTTIRYEYTHVTQSSVTATGPGGFDGLSSISVTTLGDQTKTGSRNVTSLQSGQSTFSLTVSNCTGSTTESINVITGTPPAPTLFFCVNKNPPTDGCSSTFNVKRNNSATLYWSSTNAVKVQATKGTGFNTNDKQSGSDSVTPASDGEVYTAKAFGAGSSPQTVSKSITFNFKPSVTLTVSPKSVKTGESVTLTWSTVDADKVSSSSGQNFNNITSLSGSKTVTLSSSGSYTWTITVKDNGTGLTDTASATATATDDKTVDSYKMNPEKKTNVARGSEQQSQPKFNSSPTNEVHGLSPGVSVTASISGATFLNGKTSKTVKNGTSCDDLRIKMNASNSYGQSKTATMNINNVKADFKVTTEDCVVSNGTYSLAGCTLKTRKFTSSNGQGNNRMGVIGVSGCSGTTGGNREKVTTGTIDRFANQQNTTYTLPAGTSAVEAKGIAGGGGGGKNSGEEGSGGGGGGGAFKIEWNNAEGGDVIKFFAGKGGNGRSGSQGWRNQEEVYPGGMGQDSWVEIKGKNVSQRIRSEGGEAGDEKNGGEGGRGAGALPGQPGSWFGGNGASGTARRGDEGGHGGGAGRIYASEPENSANECEVGVADPGSKPCDQGGPGRGSTFSGKCSGSNRQEKGTEEGARGNQWGGGGSGGGCGNGGGEGADGAVMIKYTISYTKYNKTDVMKRINKAYWDERNFPARGEDISKWYNKFKDEPQNYATLGDLYNKVRSSISGTKASGISDNCGGSYPKWT